MRDAFHTYTSLYRLLKMALLEFVYKIRFYFLRKIVRILAKKSEFIDVKLYIKLIKKLKYIQNTYSCFNNSEKLKRNEYSNTHTPLIKKYIEKLKSKILLS
jgi:hypothetical protein